MFTTHVRRALICASLAAPLAVAPASAAQASCVPTEVTVSPSTAAPGQRVTLASHTWFGICNDTGQRVDVTDRAVVTFVQGSIHKELGRTNSNASGFFSVTVRLPAHAVAGPAVLRVRGRSAADDVTVTVTSATLPLTGDAPLLALLGVTAVGSALALRRAGSWSGRLGQASHG